MPRRINFANNTIVEYLNPELASRLVGGATGVACQQAVTLVPGRVGAGDDGVTCGLPSTKHWGTPAASDSENVFFTSRVRSRQGQIWVRSRACGFSIAVGLGKLA